MKRQPPRSNAPVSKRLRTEQCCETVSKLYALFHIAELFEDYIAPCFFLEDLLLFRLVAHLTTKLVEPWIRAPLIGRGVLLQLQWAYGYRRIFKEAIDGYDELYDELDDVMELPWDGPADYSIDEFIQQYPEGKELEEEQWNPTKSLQYHAVPDLVYYETAQIMKSPVHTWFAQLQKIFKAEWRLGSHSCILHNFLGLYCQRLGRLRIALRKGWWRPIVALGWDNVLWTNYFTCGASYENPFGELDEVNQHSINCLQKITSVPPCCDRCSHFLYPSCCRPSAAHTTFWRSHSECCLANISFLFTCNRFGQRFVTDSDESSSETE